MVNQPEQLLHLLVSKMLPALLSSALQAFSLLVIPAGFGFYPLSALFKKILYLFVMLYTKLEAVRDLITSSLLQTYDTGSHKDMCL